MSRLPILIAAAALGAAGCAPTTSGLTAENNPSLYSVNQPVVQRTDYVLDLSSGGGALSQTELQRLDAWLVSIGAGYGDRIAVDESPGYYSGEARADVARVASDYGLAFADAPPILGGSVAPGTIRVIASRATASVPNCPNWSNKGEYPTTTTSPNYGCSVNSNLAAMIANPEDLVLGQDASSSGSTTTATRAVRTYRERPPTGRQPLQSPSTTSAQ